MGEFQQASGLEQAAGSSAFTSGEYLKFILVFIIVLLLAAWITRWLAGKTGRIRGRYLKIIDSLSLGPNRGLYLVLLVDRLFLIGAADRSVQLVAEVDDPGLVDEVRKKGEGSPFQHNIGFFQCLQRIVSPGEGSEGEGGDPGPTVSKIKAKLSKLKKDADK